MELNTNIKTGCLIFTENKNKVMKERKCENVSMFKYIKFFKHFHYIIAFTLDQCSK